MTDREASPDPGPFDPVAEASLRAPDSPAVRAADGVLTWAGLDGRVAGRAEALRAHGAGAGRVVAVAASASAEGMVDLYAVLRTGAVLAPLHPALTATEVEEALAALGPTVWIAEAGGAPEAVAGGERDASAVVGPWPGGAGSPAGRAAGPTAVPGGDAGAGSGSAAGPGARGVAVVWTSGTSGSPRGVVLTDAGIRASVRGSADRVGLGPDDRWLASLSPAHVGGLVLLLRAALLGCAVVPLAAFDAREVAAAVRRHGVTHLSLVPTQLRRVLDADEGEPPGSLRALLLGGAAAPPALVREAVGRGWPVAVTWGMTETTSQVATATPAESAADPSRVGRPLEGVEVRVEPDGELMVRGPVVSPGVVKPEPGGLLAVVPLAGPGGWLATGDLGRIDPEGRLRITGRRSQRIITGGVNVDPVEVEAALTEHPAVAEAAVLGVPDSRWGERVVAVAVAMPDAAGRRSPSVAESLERWLVGRLSGPKRPKEVRWLETLPRTPNGKVDRAVLRELFRPG